MSRTAFTVLSDGAMRMERSRIRTARVSSSFFSSTTWTMWNESPSWNGSLIWPLLRPATALRMAGDISPGERNPWLNPPWSALGASEKDMARVSKSL